MTSERTRRGTAQRWRLFVALPVPKEAASSIASALAPYRVAFPDTRWLRPEVFHVTVRFLGGTDPAAVPDLARAIESVAREAGRIDLATGPGAGVVRADRGSGVAWLTLSQGAEMVRELCTSLDPLLPLDALASPDLRPPPPAHLTVARRATGGLVGALRDEMSGATRVSWTADRMVLFRSHTGTPAGSAYEPLADVRLGVRTVA